MREPWVVSDELWELIEPLIPKRPRRFRYPGRRALDDRRVFGGMLFARRRSRGRPTCIEDVHVVQGVHVFLPTAGAGARARDC